MGTRSWSSAPGGIALALLLAPAPAAGLAGDSDEAFGLDGSLRGITAATKNYELGDPEAICDNVLFAPLCPDEADGSSQLLLRLTAGGYPTDWLRYEAHAVQSLTLVTAQSEGFGVLGAGTRGGRYRAWDAAWDWADEADVRARLWLDRGNARLVLPWADVTLGRQAVTFGKAHFWNPLDVFLAFDPFQFDRDYKPGVDALRVDVPLGDFSGLTLLGVLGEVAGEPEDVWDRSAALVRLFGNVREWDVSLQGGKLHGGWQVGAGATGEAGPVELRLEGAYQRPDARGEAVRAEDLPEAVSAVLGVGRRFDSSLFLSAEYLYNGGAADLSRTRAFELLAAGALLHTSKHVAGGVASYDLHALLRGSLATVVSLSDGSLLVQPGLVWSAADEVEVLAGAMLAFGDRPELGRAGLALNSEFGTWPHVFYVETKAYF